MNYSIQTSNQSVPPDLTAYIRSQLAAGKSKNELYQLLLAKGWAAQTLEQAFAAASTPVPQTMTPKSPQETKKSDFWPSLTSNLIFRVGFASIFLINAFVAWLSPSDFTELLESNVVFHLIGHTSLLVILVGINDFILGLLLLFKPSRYVFLWAGAWLFGVTCLKTLNLIF